MNPHKLLKMLITAGIRQAEIARKTGVSRASILHGLRKADWMPSFDVGMKLIVFAKEKGIDVSDAFFSQLEPAEKGE